MKFKLLLASALIISQISTAQDFRFGKVSQEELLEKSHPLDSTANAAILYREVKTKFDYSRGDGFFLVTDVFERVKIYNQKGFDWANKKIKLYQGNGSTDEELRGLKAVTYYLSENNKIETEKLRNDGIFEKEVSDFLNTTNFTMPNVREGCIVEYEYSIQSPFISNIDSYRLQEEIPINKVNIRFSAPEYFSYKPYQKGWHPFQVKNSRESNTLFLNYGDDKVTYSELVYIVDLNNVPALTEEAYTSNIDNYMSSLKFELSHTQFPRSKVETYATTWEDVCETIYEADNFGDQLAQHNYFDDDIDALLAGIDPQKKMTAIFEFVKQKMNWNSHFGYYSDEGVRTAYKNGTGNSGDINLMLTAMFRYAGFDANPVLVSTKSNGIPIFPTRTGFNYVLSGVKKDGSIILFDATNKFGEPNVLELEIMNWKGRMVHKDGSSAWVSLMPSEHSVQNMLISAKLSSMQITGKSRSRYTRQYAMALRKSYKDLKKEAIRKKLEGEITGTELSEITFKNLDQLYKPVNLSYNFESFGAIEKIGNKLYLSPMLFMAMDENPFKLKERTYPIDYGYPMKDRYIITINIPKTHKVVSVPKNVAYKMEDIGSFKYLITNNGNKIQLSVEFSINKPMILANKYGSLKKFYELLIAKQKEKVVLAKI